MKRKFNLRAIIGALLEKKHLLSPDLFWKFIFWKDSQRKIIWSQSKLLYLKESNHIQQSTEHHSNSEKWWLS